MHFGTEHEVNALEGDLFRNGEYNTSIHLSFLFAVVRRVIIGHISVRENLVEQDDDVGYSSNRNRFEVHTVLRLLHKQTVTVLARCTGTARSELADIS